MVHGCIRFTISVRPVDVELIKKILHELSITYPIDVKYYEFDWKVKKLTRAYLFDCEADIESLNKLIVYLDSNYKNKARIYFDNPRES